MSKKYNNRQFKPEPEEKKTELFFFPKHNPPVAVSATSREEAEEKLQALDNNK